MRNFLSVTAVFMLLALGCASPEPPPEAEPSVDSEAERASLMAADADTTLKGTCVVHEDRETKQWFYPAFTKHIGADDAFERMLDSPLRVVLEIIPEKYISYDGAKMRAHTAGEIDESQLAEPLEADTVRLERELKRRGIE